MRTFPKQVFISGIGTGVGKTLVSAVLTEALQADYWKPVQCGNLDNSDSHFVKAHISNAVTKIHNERYSMVTASSPHYAAQKEGVVIQLSEIKLPAASNKLVVEGAGGLMVPLNEDELLVDLIKYLQLPAILVMRNYLGSINHTLLSIEILKQKCIDLLGIIVSGAGFLDNEDIVQHFGKTKIIGRIEEASKIDRQFISQQALQLKQSLQQHFTF